jgi:hypothetical protein
MQSRFCIWVGNNIDVYVKIELIFNAIAIKHMAHFSPQLGFEIQEYEVVELHGQKLTGN